MKAEIRHCPRCKKKTMQGKEKNRASVFSCEPEYIYFCANCNEYNYDTIIISPYPEYPSEMIVDFKKVNK
jgi:anthranilate/para-aminobenzoate synthase component II